MIYSDLKSGGIYAATDDKIALCLDYAPKLNADTPCGRYDISDDVFVNVMTYRPKPIEEAVAETHRRYADLQLILDGEEWMGCPDPEKLTVVTMGCPDPEKLTVVTPFEEEKDIALWKSSDIALLPMRKGNWALFMPGEPHAPSLRMQECTVKKAVFKIRYSAD